MIVRRVLSVLAVAAFAATIGLVGYVRANDLGLYAVESGSMAPAMRPGDLVVDRPTAPGSTFQVGEIVTFHPTPGVTITHRIVALKPSGIVTRGDANRSADVGYIQPASIVGRVVGIVPYGGYVAFFLRQPAGIAAVFVLLALAVLVWHLASEGPTGPGRGNEATRDGSRPGAGRPGQPDRDVPVSWPTRGDAP